MKSKYLRPIRKGEYDIANISLIGYDPVSGRSYEECHEEWNAQLKDLQMRSAKTRWWNLRRQLVNRWHTLCLSSHLGMHA